MIARAGLSWLRRASDGLKSRWRNFYYRALGVNIEGYVWLRAIEISRNWSDIVLEKSVALDQGVVLLCSGPPQANKLIIRSGTYVNRYTIFDAHQQLEIGHDCMIGPHCYITDADHGTEPGHSVKEQSMKKSPVILEDEVWLGSHVVVLPGVRIGKGAVVGAGSVVTRDLPSNSVSFGQPARVVRMRSPEREPVAELAAHG
jgi:carbonic anhydrase/acetyltransferase-like protein (isoleucine patch superfamily)